MVESVATASGFSAKTPVKDLTEEQLNVILLGNGKRSVTIRHRTRRGKTYSWNTNFEGVISNLERRYSKTDSDYTRREIEKYMSARSCQSCKGKRLRPEALGVTVCGQSIIDVTSLNIGQGTGFCWAGPAPGLLPICIPVRCKPSMRRGGC